MGILRADWLKDNARYVSLSVESLSSWSISAYTILKGSHVLGKVPGALQVIISGTTIISLSRGRD